MQREIKAERMTDERELLVRRVLADEVHRRVARREVQYREDERRGAPDHDDRVQEAPQQVGSHRRLTPA